MLKVLFTLLFVANLLLGNELFTKEEQNWIEQNKHIKVSIIDNFHPFSYVENNQAQGLTVDLLKELSNISGLKFELTTSKWKQSLNKFKNHQVDMIADISQTKKRENFTLFTKPYYEIPTFIFGMNNNKDYINNNSLKGRKVGVSKNIFYIEKLKKEGIKVIEFKESIDKAKALVTGKIDYFLASYTSGVKAITSQSLITIKPFDELKLIKKEDLRFGITKTKPILHSIMQKSLQTIGKNQRSKLSEKWILSNHRMLKELKFTHEEKEYIKNSPLIKIGSMNTYAPFSFIQNNKKIGLSQDLIDLISKKSGLRFEKIGGSWSEILDKFKNKKLDMISEISYKEDRLPFTSFSKAYFEVPIGIFARKEFGVYNGLKSFRNKKIAIVKKSILKDVIKDIEGIKIVEVDTVKNKLKLLNTQKVDVVLSGATSINLIEQMLFKDIKLIDILSLPNSKIEDLRFGIDKDNPILASIINKTLDYISYSEMTNLKQKWIIEYEQLEQNKTLSFTKKEKEFIKNNPTITYSEINWKPLSIIENGKMKGVMGDYLDLVSKRTGLSFKYIPSKSWSHVLEQFKDKQIDLVPGIGGSVEDMNLGLISDTYAKYPMAIVTGKKYKYLDNLDTLNNKNIAVPKNYTSYNFLLSRYPKINLIPTKDIPDALLLVKNGKADAFVGHIATSIYYMSELHLEELKISGTADFIFEHKYLIQNDNPVLFSIINKALSSILEVEKKDIYNKWVQTTITQEKVNYKIVFGILFLAILIVLYFLYKQYILKKAIEDTNEIIDATMEAMFITKDGIVLDVNQSAVELFGYDSKKQMQGLNVIDLATNDDKQIIRDKLEKDKTKPYEAHGIRQDGTTFPGLVKGQDLKSKKIRVSSVIDLTQIKQLEAQSRLISMGEMIGNIAHQWRQPLSVISTATTGMQLQKSMNTLNDHDFNKYCTYINENVQYLSQTIDDFRNFIKGDTKLLEFSFKDNINSFIKLIDSTIKKSNIKLILQIDNDIKILGYPNELIQCFINIVNNSKDAIIENNIKADERYIFISQKVVKDTIVIEFQDNAGGIQEDIISKIFEPYFTTKHQSQGTGLGLNISYSLIVQHMKGTIKVTNKNFEYKNKNYKGALFTITLPLSQI